MRQQIFSAQGILWLYNLTSLSAPISALAAAFSLAQVTLHVSACLCVSLPDSASDNDLVLEQPRLAMTQVAMATACNRQQKSTMSHCRLLNIYVHLHLLSISLARTLFLSLVFAHTRTQRIQLLYSSIRLTSWSTKTIFDGTIISILQNPSILKTWWKQITKFSKSMSLFFRACQLHTTSYLAVSILLSVVLRQIRNSWTAQQNRRTWQWTSLQS